MSTNIMAIRIEHRSRKAPDVQEILTRFGCNIKMRLGLHETSDTCSDKGLILLQLTDDCPELEKELERVEGVISKSMQI